MERSQQGSRRPSIGGIISLARFCEDHAEALTYDLITRTSYQLEDVGGALSWSSLKSFIKFLGSDSALAKDLNKATGWEDTIKTNAILADIFDLLQVINKNICNSKKTIKPYPRPGKEEDNTRRIGKGSAMPLDDLKEWINRRRLNG